jgi:hypothetical protein
MARVGRRLSREAKWKAGKMARAGKEKEKRRSQSEIGLDCANVKGGPWIFVLLDAYVQRPTTSLVERRCPGASDRLRQTRNPSKMRG